MKTLFLFLILSSSSLLAMHEVIPDCYLYFSPVYKDKIKFNKKTPLKIMSYNTLNLKRTVGLYSVSNGVKTFKPGITPKPEWQTKWISDIIKKQDLDIVVLQEVEGRQAIYEFNRIHLRNKYEVFYIGGNDVRGINVAFLVHRRLPFRFEIHSHRKLTMRDPTPGKDRKKIEQFSRDFPTLIIKDDKEKPLFTLSGLHFKSQRPRGNDPTSMALRAAQMKNAFKILRDYNKKYKNIPMIVAGDFNADIRFNPEFSGLRGNGFLKDVFNSIKKPLDPKLRVTHSYHPKNKAPIYSQLDGIFHRNFKVLKAHVYRYKNRITGKEKPLPKSWDERNKNPSDHYPIIATVKLED